MIDNSEGRSKWWKLGYFHASQGWPELRQMPGGYYEGYDCGDLVASNIDYIGELGGGEERVCSHR